MFRHFKRKWSEALVCVSPRLWMPTLAAFHLKWTLISDERELWCTTSPFSKKHLRDAARGLYCAMIITDYWRITPRNRLCEKGALESTVSPHSKQRCQIKNPRAFRVQAFTVTHISQQNWMTKNRSPASDVHVIILKYRCEISIFHQRASVSRQPLSHFFWEASEWPVG